MLAHISSGWADPMQIVENAKEKRNALTFFGGDVVSVRFKTLAEMTRLDSFVKLPEPSGQNKAT